MADTDLFDAYFKRADLDGDGQISGAEAVAFFQGSGLPKQVLAQVWTYADQRKAGYLGRQEFYNALKLVTVAQSKRELTPDIVKAALYSPASAKIPAPQINLAATPASRVGAPAPQVAGTTLGATSQNVGIRPPLAIESVSTSQQFFPTQQNQHGRPPHAIPPSTVSHPEQVPANQGMPKGTYTPAPRPSTSNTQIANQGISPPATQDGFGMMASGFTPSAQPRPQTTTGQLPSTGPKPQDAVAASNQPATKDSKQVGTVENGFPSDSLFGDVFAASPLQPKQSSLSVTSSASSLPSSSPNVPLSAAPQPSAKPSPLDTLRSTFSQQTGGLPLTGMQNEQVASQGTAALPSTGLPVGAGNSVPSQSQFSWPRMTQSDIQKYVKVFVEVDTDRDGKITGVEARNLFLSWRLPREVLKLVWDLSDQDNDSMLSLREFCTALYLMERYREGHPLPTTLPSSVMADKALLSTASRRTPSNVSGTWGPASGVKHPHTMTGARPPSAAAAKPPKPRSVSHTDEKQTSQQKPKVPILEKHLTDQLGQEEQDSLNTKFQEAARADKEVGELEKEISESRQKIEFFSAKMQELVLYKSRCDNRLNEVKARVSVERNEVEALAKKYEEKYRQTGDVASKLTIEEATFRDIQERKMELYRTIVEMEGGGTAADVLKEQVEHIQSGLEELAKTVNERCKQYGLRSKPTSLVELPFGWQPGIQEGAADWDEHWDKFEDEGFKFVEELTLDVQNFVAPPKTKSSTVQITSSSGDESALSSNAQLKPEKVPSPGEPKPEKDSAHYPRENGESRSPSDSPAGWSETENHELSNTPFRESADADGSPYAKEVQSDVGGAESVLSGDRSADESHSGAFDTYYDTESVWGLDGGKSFQQGVDHEGHESSIFGGGDFNLNPIRTGPSGSRSPFLFADSVPGTPAYDLGKSSFVFDSFPSTRAYDQWKGSALFDSVPSTPAYNQGKSTFMFADSVPSTPSYNFGNSLQRFSEGSEDHSFDSFSRFDSFSMHDSGSFQSSHPSIARFDSMRSTVDSDQNYGFPSRFDSFRESRDSEQSHAFSRFDSFGDSDQSHGFSRFDSVRDSDHGQGFPARFDSFRESKDSEHSHGFSRFDSFSAHDSVFLQSPGNSLAGFDSARGPRDPGNSYGFSSIDDTDPFGSNGPFRTSLESETPRKRF